MKIKTTSTNRRNLDGKFGRAAMFCLLALAAVLFQGREARAQWTPPDAQGNISNTNAGNIGIGTASPTALLNLRVTDGDVVSRLSNAGGSGGALDLRYKYESQQHRVGFTDGNANWLFYTQFAPANTDSVGFFPGRVGIGTTSAQVKLSIGGAGTNVYATDAWVENNMHVQGNEPLVQGGRGRLRVGTAWGYMGVYAETSSSAVGNDLVLGAGSGNVRVGPNASVGAAPMNFFVPNGNVGVGTSTPGILNGVNYSAYIPLHIQRQGAMSASVLVDTAVPASGYVINDSSQPVDNRIWAVSQGAGGGKLTFASYTDAGAPTSRVVLDRSGNMGIGTTTPASRLHVAGNITVDGNINAKYQDVAEWVPSTEKLSAGTVVVLDTTLDNYVATSTSAYDTRVAGVVSAQPGIALGEAGEDKALVATTGRVKVKVDATQGPIKVGDLLVTSNRPGYAMKSEPITISGRQLHAPGTIIGKALSSLDKGTGEILVLLSLQ